MSGSELLISLTFGLVIPALIIAYMVYTAFIRKRRAFAPLAESIDEAVIVKIYGWSIEDRYNNWVEFRNLVGRLDWALGIDGQIRPVQIDSDAVIVTIVGECAETMYAKIRKVVRHVSFASNAHITLRFGPPGSPERRTHMAN